MTRGLIVDIRDQDSCPLVSRNIKPFFILSKEQSTNKKIIYIFKIYIILFIITIINVLEETIYFIVITNILWDLEIGKEDILPFHHSDIFSFKIGICSLFEKQNSRFF